MQPLNLNDISVKSPCTVPWETMTGDERTRFCAQCKLNVFNLSGMNRAEAEEIIRNKEGRLCVRYVKRADGTVITKDCSPIRAARLRRAAAFAIASVLTMAMNLILWMNRDERNAASENAFSGRNTRGANFARIQESKLYRSNPQVQAVVDWSERQIAPTPEPYAITGLMICD